MLPENVRVERTGWRDQEISNRHRMWGFNCPCVDLDFLVVEYNIGKPVALVEYKAKGAREPLLDHATYRALKDLADGYRVSPLPFMVVFYRTDIWAFQVRPINNEAKKWFINKEVLTERDYVSRLYEMRSLTLKEGLLPHLVNVLPTKDAA